MKILELFAGNQSFSKQGKKHGHEVFTVDWGDFEGIDLRMDIGEMQVTDIPFVPDLIWASPDCATYSVAGLRWHRGLDRAPKSDYAVLCDRVNTHLISILNDFKNLNSNLIYFIENPRGLFRHMPFAQGLPRQTIWYCQYGDIRAKPTDLFTNSTWLGRKQCFNSNTNCHHEKASRGSNGGTQGLSWKGRSAIPIDLCEDILNSLESVYHQCFSCGFSIFEKDLKDVHSYCNSCSSYSFFMKKRGVSRLS